jgi:hypothetical protein
MLPKFGFYEYISELYNYDSVCETIGHWTLVHYNNYALQMLVSVHLGGGPLVLKCFRTHSKPL